MAVPDWFYFALLILYSGALLFLFIDMLHSNRKAHRGALWLLFMVWILQGSYFFSRLVVEKKLPFLSPADTLFFYSWLIVSFSLLITFWGEMALVLFSANLFGFAVLAISLLQIERRFSPELAGQLHSEWVLLHIVLAFLSYAAFTLSGIASLIYLIQHALLKKKKIRQFYRWPSLSQLEQAAWWSNLLGIPLLMISLVLGMIWAYYRLEILIWLDAKVLFSILIIALYSSWFFQRLARGWSGKQLAELNVICFLVLMVNYLVSIHFTQFHV